MNWFGANQSPPSRPIHRQEVENREIIFEQDTDGNWHKVHEQSIDAPLIIAEALRYAADRLEQQYRR